MLAKMLSDIELDQSNIKQNTSIPHFNFCSCFFYWRTSIHWRDNSSPWFDEKNATRKKSRNKTRELKCSTYLYVSSKRRNFSSVALNWICIQKIDPISIVFILFRLKIAFYMSVKGICYIIGAAIWYFMFYFVDDLSLLPSWMIKMVAKMKPPDLIPTQWTFRYAFFARSSAKYVPRFSPNLGLESFSFLCEFFHWNSVHFFPKWFDRFAKSNFGLIFCNYKRN